MAFEYVSYLSDTNTMKNDILMQRLVEVEPIILDEPTPIIDTNCLDTVADIRNKTIKTSSIASTIYQTDFRTKL